MTDGPRRKPGPRLIGPQVNFSMPPELVHQIDQAAAGLNISRSEWVRRACRQALDTPTKETKL